MLARRLRFVYLSGCGNWSRDPVGLKSHKSPLRTTSTRPNAPFPLSWRAMSISSNTHAFALSRTMLLLVLFAALLWFATLAGRSLVHPDEGRYAEIAREMALSGDFVTPRLNDIKYFEKPALQYWMTALAFTVFGESDWAARLWTALTGFLSALMVGYTARRLWGEQAGCLAASVLLGSLWWIANGHFSSLDMGVAASMCLALCSTLLAQRNEATARERRNWMLLAWAGMALAVLSKGLIGLVLPGGVLVAYTLWQRDWRLWTRLQLVWGLLLFLLIAAPWFVLVSQRNPEFAHFFFIHEHFERFTSTEHKREGAWWYFFPVLLAGFLPWVSLLPGIARRGWAGAQGFAPERLLLVWSVFIFAFFSYSGSKLPSYILPIFPALALLAARHLTTLPSRRVMWHALVPLLLGLLLPVLAWRVGQEGGNATEVAMNQAFAGWLLLAGAVIALCGAIAVWLARQGRAQPAVLAMAASMLIGGQLGMLGHESYSGLRSGKILSAAIKPHLHADMPLYAVGYYDQTVPFYLQRTLRFVDFSDEFTFGMKQEPDKRALTLAEFEQQWRNGPAAIALMLDETYLAYRAAGWPLRVLYEDATRVAVSNR